MPHKSILNLTPEEIKYYTQNRLLPKSNVPQAYWGCSSTTGFLAPEDNLVEIAQRDKKSLETLGITFEQVANVIDELISVARREPEKLVNGLQITLSQPTACFQYCPLSLSSESKNILAASCCRENFYFYYTKLAAALCCCLRIS